VRDQNLVNSEEKMEMKMSKKLEINYEKLKEINIHNNMFTNRDKIKSNTFSPLISNCRSPNVNPRINNTQSSKSF